MKITSKFTPCLWFDNQAEEAAKFYTSIFDNSKITQTARYGEAGAEVSGQKKGSVMTVSFELEGQPFLALNGGLLFKFSEAISFIVNCENQKEIDVLWEKLTAGGQEQPCGWLKDKFGLSWQIVPADWDEMMQDTAKAERVMKALLPMKKIDIKTLQQAYNSETVNA